MSVSKTIFAGTKQNKNAWSRVVEFSTMTEAFALAKEGKAPKGFDSAKHFFACAYAHRVVEIQNELRPKPEASTSRSDGKDDLFD